VTKKLLKTGYLLEIKKYIFIHKYRDIVIPIHTRPFEIQDQKTPNLYVKHNLGAECSCLKQVAIFIVDLLWI
jgi:hypothetical protein